MRIGLVPIIAFLGFASCGGSAETANDVLGIGLIDDAVAAARASLAEEPLFFEINSTADGVNLFIASRRGGTSDPEAIDGVRQARYTTREGLVLSDEVLEASGPVFSTVDVELSFERVTAQVRRELQSATPLMFVITAATSTAAVTVPSSTAGTSAPSAAPTSGIAMRIIMESARGGRLSVFVDGDGNILGTDVLSAAVADTSDQTAD